MKKITETERLILREFTKDDAAFIVELLNSEGWLGYIGDRNVHNESQAINYLECGSMRSYQTKGFGFYGVILKESHELIGMCGFIQREKAVEVEIGYAFLPAFQRKGYASEAVKATLHYGFQTLKLEKLIAIARANNFSSIKLLEKLGFTLEKTYDSEEQGEKLVLFILNQK